MGLVFVSSLEHLAFLLSIRNISAGQEECSFLASELGHSFHENTNLQEVLETEACVRDVCRVEGWKAKWGWKWCGEDEDIVPSELKLKRDSI